MTPENMNLQNFAVSFNVENLKHEATCFKGLPSCIYLIITNRYRNRYLFTLKNTCVTATGMSDFHKLTAVSLKSQVLKASSNRKLYGNYKNFDEDKGLKQ